MKQLFWKEWHELRLLPLGAALLCALLFLGYLMGCRLQLDGLNMGNFNESALIIFLAVVWLLSAVIAGSGLISQEIGAGSLTFLFSFPVSRRRIWLIKAASGFTVLVLCALCSGFACSLLWGFTVQWARPEPDLARWLGAFLGDAFLAAAGCYAVSLAVSPLLDRYISATMVSVLACILIAYVIVAACSGPFRNQYQPDLSSRLMYACMWLAIPAMLAISYWTFTHGESLRSVKRFYAAGAAASVAFVVFLALFLSIRAYAVAHFLPPGVPVSSDVLPFLEDGSISFPWEDVNASESFWIRQPLLTSAVEELLVDGKIVSSKPIALNSEPSKMTFSAEVRVLNPKLPKLADPLTAPVDTPPMARFAVKLATEDHASRAIPFTLKFANGAGAFDFSGSPANAASLIQSDTAPVIVDLLFIDRSLKRAPRRWVHEPDDPTFLSHFAPDTVHRITVKILFAPKQVT